eukprot:704717-Amphidinium_carterae.1
MHIKTFVTLPREKKEFLLGDRVAMLHGTCGFSRRRRRLRVHHLLHCSDRYSFATFAVRDPPAAKSRADPEWLSRMRMSWGAVLDVTNLHHVCTCGASSQE